MLGTESRKSPFDRRRGGEVAPDGKAPIIKALLNPPFDKMCRWSGGGGPFASRTTESLPHIKTYCRFRFVCPFASILLTLHPLTHDFSPRLFARPRSQANPDDEGTELAWVFLTSSNMSKAAHGYSTQSNVDTGNQKILSWELGVLMLPRHFCNDAPPFSLDETVGQDKEDLPPNAKVLKRGRSREAHSQEPQTQKSPPQPQQQSNKTPKQFAVKFIAADAVYQAWCKRHANTAGGKEAKANPTDAQLQKCVLFPIPYCLPPRDYAASDQIWTVDAPHPVPDRLGRIMCTENGQQEVILRL